MRRNGLLLIALSLCIALIATSCRHKPLPPPVVAPEPVKAPEPVTETVQTPEKDFVPEKPAEEVLSSDMSVLTRTAHERGWIADAFFAFDASTLDANAQAALSKSATWTRGHSEYGLLIEGHCDERGTEQYNLALGDRRAETAAAQLAALGVDRSRIKTVSYGEERPFEEGSTEDAWAQNRRAHLVITQH